MRAKVLICFGVLALATPAQAATYLVTVTGTATSINDFFGALGAPGQFYANLPYQTVYTLVTDKPGATSTNDGVRASISGSGSSSPVSAALTINGVAFGFSGISGGYVQAYNNLPVGSETLDYLRVQASEYQNDGVILRDMFVYDEVGSYVNQIISSAGVPTALDYTVQAGDDVNGFFRQVVYDQRTGRYSAGTAGILKPERFTIRLAAATVPEPSAWLLLIAGFGAVGGAMRQSRRRATIRFATGGA